MGKRIERVKALLIAYADKDKNQLYNHLCLSLCVRNETVLATDKIMVEYEIRRGVLSPPPSIPPYPKLLLYEDKITSERFWAIDNSASHVRDLTNHRLREKAAIKLLNESLSPA